MAANAEPSSLTFMRAARGESRLACETNRFAGIAAVAGYPTESVAEHCTNRTPVSVLDLHATADPRVLYETARQHEFAPGVA